MTKETLREQNERLHKELEEARVQIQQLQWKVSKLNDATNAAYEKSSCYKADQACIKNLLSQLKIFKNQLMISRQEKRKVDERIRSLNNLERDTAAKNMEHAQDILNDISKNSEYYKVLIHELEVAHSDYRRLKYVNDQLEENNEVLKQRVEDLENSIEECHEATIEAYQLMRESNKRYEAETAAQQKKIWALQKENKKLWNHSGNIDKNPFGAGRKKNDKTYMKRYVEFCDLSKKGMSITEIMETMQISRSTYFRFLKGYKEDCEMDAIHDEITNSSSLKNNK